MQGLSLNFLDYLRKKSTQINDEIIEKAKDCLFDYLAVTQAGAAANRERWSGFLKHIPKGNTPLQGLSVTTDSKTACLVNGFNAHSLELDDGHRFAMIHLGASIITAIEAARSENNISRRSALVGIIMGYEAACRLALSIQPAHKNKGFHTAGTCGTVGSAIGVGYALAMNDNRLRAVLDCAAVSSAGMLEIQEQSSELKPYNLGRAAMDGLTAAYMGFTDWLGPDDILGGERGFLRIFGDGGTPEKMTADSDYFEIERIYVKPYAACRHCHSAIEAVLSLRSQCSLSEVERIVIETYNLAVKGHDHTDIAGVSSAKLSMPYSAAAAFVLGRADVWAFSRENVTDDRILSLARKVRVEENAEFSSDCPQRRVAKVTIFKKDGSYCEKRVDYAKGDPENPMSRGEIIKKGVELLGEQRAEELSTLVYGI